MVSAPKLREATVEETLARPERDRVELIRGTLVEKAAPTQEHARTQVGLAVRLANPFQRRTGGRWPGGWRFLTAIDVQLGSELFRPDISGWRRDLHPELPSGRPLQIRPDWICEILSVSNESRDRVDKLQSYFAASVPHYWLANPVERMLEVYRRTDLGYALLLSAKSGQKIRAEPFDAVELRVDELFGDDPEGDE
jgi:Uma2 family endonuclease